MFDCIVAAMKTATLRVFASFQLGRGHKLHGAQPDLLA
jgi:hypothetical protein